MHRKYTGISGPKHKKLVSIGIYSRNKFSIPWVYVVSRFYTFGASFGHLSAVINTFTNNYSYLYLMCIYFSVNITNQSKRLY